MSDSIDTVVLKSQLLRVRSEIESVERSIANMADDCLKSVARLDRILCSLKNEEARLDDALSWHRMNELIHTPCWRYRVV
jgi:hypothetical protein